MTFALFFVVTIPRRTFTMISNKYTPWPHMKYVPNQEDIGPGTDPIATPVFTPSLWGVEFESDIRRLLPTSCTSASVWLSGGAMSNGREAAVISQQFGVEHMDNTIH